MWKLAMGFFKQNLTTVVSGILFALAILYHFYTVDNLETELVATKNVVAVVTYEYEKALGTAKHNADELNKVQSDYFITLEEIDKKHQDDLDRVKESYTIIERTRNVSEEDDGNVSNITNSTLDALRMLREEREL